MVLAGKKQHTLFCMIDTDSHADFSDLASDTVSAAQDEDGEWKLSLRLDIGGDGK